MAFLGFQLQAEQNDALRSLSEKEISIYKDSINLYKSGALTKATLNTLLSKNNISLKDLCHILRVSKEQLINDISKKWKYNILYGTVAVSSISGCVGSCLLDMFSGLFALSSQGDGSVKIKDFALLKKIEIVAKYFFTLCLATFSFDCYKWYHYNASIKVKKQEIETIDTIMGQLKFGAL